MRSLHGLQPWYMSDILQVEDVIESFDDADQKDIKDDQEKEKAMLAPAIRRQGVLRIPLKLDLSPAAPNS